ncbi:MAG: tetratricopeptide repeat protein [Treponema sp.]|nr:tetratricopeptide repeat protein [Candidatus Treponema equi]
MKRSKKEKKVFAILTGLLMSAMAFAGPSDSVSSDSWIYSEIVSAYSGAAYPSVIEHVDTLERTYPDSAYLYKSILYKGESLFCLGRFSEAESVLLRGTISDSIDVQVQSWYWLGRTRLMLEKNKESLEAFYRCCQISSEKKISKKSENYYNLALYYAGKTYFAMGQYSDCIPIFESVVTRGNEYPVSVYSDSFTLLFRSYNETGRTKDLLSLYRKTPKGNTPELASLYGQLSLYAAEAYEKGGDYKNAWKCCLAALDCGDGALASEAFRTAYRISGKYEKQSGEDTAPVLEKASEKLAGNPDLLAEFWTRIATDCYEDGDYEGAKKYFDKAQENDVNKKYASLIALYRARLNGETLQLVGSVNEDGELYVDYEISFAEQYAAIDDWKLCYSHSQKAYEKLDPKLHNEDLCRKTAYYYALAILSYGKATDAENIIEKGKATFVKNGSYYSASRKLLARCYSVTGKEADALNVYSSLDKNGELAGEEKADYAKLLFSCGYLSSSKKVGIASGTQEGKYVAALSCFNLKEWQQAEQLFEQYLVGKSRKNTGYAVFYLGYCQYRLAKKNAVDTLENFGTRFKGHTLCYSAAIVCANAALQNGDYEKAAAQANAACNYAKTQGEKENAVLLCASVYADAGKTDLAINSLAPYIKDSSEFGVAARYRTAIMQSRMGRINESDRLFAEIQNKFPESVYAEESSYRRGELFYTAKNYSAAVTRFDEYRKKYPKGNFYESAIFYSGDSHVNLKEKDKAILDYQLLLLENPKSPYGFASAKNLVSLYKEQKNYDKAMEYSKVMYESALTADQKAEAKKESDLLGKIAKSGEPTKAVELREKYNSLGGIKTAEGRMTGTEYAEYLWNENQNRDEALDLCEKLHAAQTKARNIGQECGYAARTAVILALSERSANQNASSAEIFLSAAKYARQAGDDALASRCLYGAAEAFDAAGKKGDSRATAENLMEMYPGTEYAKSARVFIK